MIGYDGSEMFGREEIASTLGQIFADHQTAAYVTKVRDVRLLTPNIARLRAVAGLVPPGQSDIAAQLNAIQTLIAVKREGELRAPISRIRPRSIMAGQNLRNS